MPTTPWTRRRPLACVMTAAALAAGALIGATSVVPQRARAQDSGTQTAPQATAADGVGAEAAAGGNWCARIPPGFGHPPANLTPLALHVLDPSIEPVQTTDGLIHLAYIAQVTNTQTTPADIASVVPVDALAGFAPTGRNSPIDAQGNDVAGQVELFATAQFPGPSATPSFTASVPAGNAGLMYFDVTYTDPAQIPRLLSHAITLASPNDGGPGTPALTDPVPVGCKQLAVLHPPLVGQGWLALHGCCRVAYHRTDALLAINGTPHTSEGFAIDYFQVGPNGTCCHGPVTDPNSWYDYGSPVLAAAPGVVVSVTDGIPDNNPVGTIPPLEFAHGTGNNVAEDIGGGRYVFYLHLQSGSIPASVRPGARLRPGTQIGRLGNSGGSSAPHLHFQVADTPSAGDASGLPFAFDAQMVEGSVPEGIYPNLVQGAVVPIDRTGAGIRRDLYPARNGVFGFSLSSSQ